MGTEVTATSAAEPRAHQLVQAPRVRRGIVIINTGEGKGKTTAALGVMLRAWGRDMRVRLFEFIERDRPRGEHVAAARAEIPIHPLGGDGDTDPQARVMAQWAAARDAVVAGDDDVVVLDDLTAVIEADWLDVEAVIAALRDRPPLRHVIVTGRLAPEALIAAADLVTDMQPIAGSARPWSA